MTHRILLLAAALAVSAGTPARGQDVFTRHFTDRTMRVDYFHTGGKGTEVVALDRVVFDGPWAGSRTRLVDDTGLGKYLFEVLDAATGRVLYSRGFASIYGEWETTAEPRSAYRTFHESLRFPWPLRPVRVVLKKRAPDNRRPQADSMGVNVAFQELWRTEIDPASRFVNPAALPARGRVFTLFENGPASEKVDLLLVGEGYTEAEAEKFRADAGRLIEKLFAQEPFRGRRGDFNVRATWVPVPVSGVSRPRAGLFRRTPVSAEFNALDLERYVLTTDNRALRDVASAAPYEFVTIFVNDAQYGGGGIFMDHSTVAVDSEFADYVFVHEFGHHFAALGDEYYTSDVPYQTGAAVKIEPWEPNLTALRDPARLKWKDLVQATTPLPTPWGKAAFEARGRRFREERRRLIEAKAPPQRVDSLLMVQRRAEAEFLRKQKWYGKVGAFEGAGYETTGLYRPEIDCIMFSRNPVGFCDVCRRAIARIIDLYARA